MFDFPASPSTGTIYSPAGGPQYLYDGQKWKLLGSGRTAQARNRIVNPCMQISQELGAGNTITPQAYIVDQWQAQVGGIAFSGQKTNITARQISITVTTGKTLAASDYLGFSQSIEGVNVSDFNYGTSIALPSVLRFDVYASVVGTFGISVRNGVANRTLVLPFTVSAVNAWTTFTLPIPGDTAGTWAVDNTAGLSVAIIFACGTTYTTAVTGWQAGNFLTPTGITNGALTTNNIFYIRNVGLYLDPDATGLPPPFQVPAYDDDLQACMRYWQQTLCLFSGSVNTGNSYLGPGFLQERMRAGPILSGGNITQSAFPATVGGYSNIGAGGIAITENRAANVTGVGWFQSVVTANARM